jgi:hypothetical protein
VPEMSPQDLPEGASPYNMDVDFAPGKVFTRGGRTSIYTFADLFVEEAAAFGQNFQDAANELAWTSPDNIATNTPGTYASVQLNTDVSPTDGVIGIDGGVGTFAGFDLNPFFGATISGMSWSAGVVIVQPSDFDSAEFAIGATVTILDSTPGGYNGTFEITEVNFTFETFSYNLASNPGTYEGGASVAIYPFPTPGNTDYAVWNLFGRSSGVGSLTPISGWDTLEDGTDVYGQVITEFTLAGGTFAGGEPIFWCGCNVLLKLQGVSAPTVLQVKTGSLSPEFTIDFDNPTTPGSTLLFSYTPSFTITFPTDVELSDDASGGSNNWSAISGGTENASGGAEPEPGLPFGPAAHLAVVLNSKSMKTLTVTGGGTQTGTVEIYELQTGSPGVPSLSQSQELQALNFPFSIPTTTGILGFQVVVNGKQSSLAADCILTLSLINPAADSPTFTFQLPTTDGSFTAGTPSTSWGLALTPAIFNNPNFGVQIKASAVGGTPVTFDISGVEIIVWETPAPPSNFNWVKTYEQDDGDVDTLALDANGVLWDESVTNDPGVFSSIFQAIEPNTFAKSVTFDDVEYIAFSNQTNGTDVPRTWNGQWLDRLSQVGPGAPPSVSGVSSGSAIINITQNAPVLIPVGTGTSGSWLEWSAAPADLGAFGLPSTPGNVLTWIFPKSFTLPAYFTVGSNVVLSGMQTMNGVNLNNGVGTNPAFYTITSVGVPDPNMDYYDGFTVSVLQTGFYNQRAGPGTQIQATIATLTASQQVPYLEVGNSMIVEGNSEASYNNSWTVTATPNAAQLTITNTSLTGGVATYGFTLVSGTTPAVGQFVTVTGTLNGGGIFNVTNGVINTATASTFTILIPAPNVSGAAETNATGIISGTIFQFDPATQVANPIIGTGTGGTVGTAGVMGVGVRQCVCIFQTREGSFTAPSPYVQFNITTSDNAIVAAQIPVGPSNVTARVLAFTGAGGANFFYIPIPVTVTTNGQQVTYSATVINDNTTTQVTLSFPDAVLLAGNAIDVQGNNLFEQIELGSSLGVLSYDDRLIAWGEQNKVQNFLNLSFDGGRGVQGATAQNTGSIPTYFPLGWTVDPAVTGTGVNMLTSPIFGDALYLQNASGSTQGIWARIFQGAYQDQYMVPIIQSNTLYSIRVTARCPSGVTSGALTMILYSPKLNTIFGSFSEPLASMSTTMQIFTGTWLTTEFSQVPNDLIFMAYLTNVPNGGDCEVDRVEPFPTAEPVFATEFHASYVDNPEAFDLVTGLFGPSQNQQPIRGGAVLFDTLYALKSSSMYSTTDNGVTEPSGWSWREVSNRVGTISTQSYDYGEGWLITACRSGVYMFTGGEPIKMSQEIQPVWELINWTYAQTIWLRNDETNRRVYIGVPIATPNPYMPEFPVNANPTQPNCILMCNYRELNTGIAIADTGPIRASYTGRLLAPEPARKWSFWNIVSPYADFILRPDNSSPLFLCTGYGNSKIFELDDDNLSDDGVAINSYYITSPFTKPDTAQALGIGQHRLLAMYMTILATGTGNLNTQILPDSPQSTIPSIPTPIPLDLTTLGDLEIPINRSAQRFFIRSGTNAVGASFSQSKVVLSLSMDKLSPLRGTARGRG